MYHFELKINLLFSEIELKKLIGFASEKIKKFEIVGNNLKIYIDDADDEELVKNKVNKLLKRYVLTEDKENIELIGKLPNAFNNYDDIYNSDLVHKFEHGQIALINQAKKLFEFFDSSFAEIAKSFGAVEKLYPALIPVDAYQETGYLKISPQYSIFCSSPHEDIDLLVDINKKVTENDIHESLSEPKFGLSPSACFHTYIEYRNKNLDNNTVVTFNQNVFRNEGRFCWDDYGRLMDYHVREIVLIGTEKFVADTRKAILEEARKFIEKIGLCGEIATASDPFVIPTMQKYKKLQMQEKSKYELKLLCSNEKKLACASFNFHGESFTHPFNIRVKDATPTVTGCIGFGIERWILAYLAQFGTDVNNWSIKL